MDSLEITPAWRIPLAEFAFTYTRSSGPGGQNVNKVSSKATLRWALLSSPNFPHDARQRFLERFGQRLTGEGDLLITSQRFRDQDRNRADCLDKLRELLDSVARAPKRRRATRPTRGSRERRLREKQTRSDVKRMRRSPPRGE